MSDHVRPARSRSGRNPLGWIAVGLGLALTGLGCLVLVVLALLLAPFAVWLAWNVLDFGAAIGLGDLGFWGIVLLAIFLAAPWPIQVLVLGVVFLIEPSWYAGSAELRFPEPSLQNLLAAAILLAVAAVGHLGSGSAKK